ncbi:efflux RND transporter permease subunit [Capnocytophaga gingivalis]
MIKTFIQRPILSAVLSVLIILMGSIALLKLPVEQYPDMAPPTVNVSTSYPGANAETVIKSVITPLEEAINGVEGMTYITSSASNSGEANITVFFKKGTHPDMAAVNVQNRVQSALSNMPAEVTKQGVVTEKQQNSELMTFSLYSENKSFDENFLNNYMSINIIPQLKRVQGVGKIMLYGSNYNMRIWLSPDKMAQYKLIPSDITAALTSQNIEAATGTFGENSQNTYVYTMKYRGRFSTPEEFGQIVIRSLEGGQLLRLSDVATVEMGSDSYNYTTTLDGAPAAIAMLQQRAGSNASQIIKDLDRELLQIQKQLPNGLKFQKINDANQFLNASIKLVVSTLLEALLLVVLVVYVFLQDLRSTFIPSVCIVISLIGAFAFMQLAGFSINLLTLFALVLAIGTVVDDAIIVVEAVQANFDKGYRSSYLATHDAMGNVSKALFTSTLIFMAVFIPMSFMGGTSGTFYRQFGLTIAVAVGISAINAFTLSPALCALLLRPYTDENGNEKQNFAARFRKAFNAVFVVMSRKYAQGVLWLIRRKYIAFTSIVLSGGLLYLLVKKTPTGLVPDEDMGMLYVNLTTKAGTSMQENAKALAKLEDALKQIQGIDHYALTNGYSFTSSGSNAGMFFVPLKDWKERSKEESAEAISASIQQAATTIPEAKVLVMAPSPIPGFGISSGFELNLQDRMGRSTEEFQKVKDNFVAELQKQPEIESAYSDFSALFPQYWVDIDAVKCQRAGITPQEVLETIASYYGGSYISNFNRFSRLYNVTMQAPPEQRAESTSLERIFVRLSNGEMAPVSTFVKLTPTQGAQTLSRFNLFNSITIIGSPASGRSNSEAIKAVERVAKKQLPTGYSYEWGGLSLEESKSSNNFIWVFALSTFIIYLVLVALYESLVLPFAVILTVPAGVLGSFAFANIVGLHNDIYMQTGVVLLIGLLAKTAILITEYASERRKEGMSLSQAAYIAAKERFRPILMTVLTMILGMIPLMLASGAGANGSRSLATGVVGGMLIGSTALLFLVPVLFVVCQWIQERLPKSPINVESKETQTQILLEP